jgi:single-strand DNA-binding protein
MAGVNKVIIIGNLGADPECRQTNSGSTVANLRLAVNERKKSASGEWEDHVEWVRVVCFGKTAENVQRFLSKGRQVYVEGKMRTTKWQDSTGADKWTTEVVANTVQFLGSKDGQAPRSSQPSGTQYQGGYGGKSDDDVPF